MKKAILFGASGFIGSYLLDELLNSEDYKEVMIVVRKKLPVSHAKLTTLIADFNSLPGLANNINADEVFIALGTTQKNTPDKKAYYQADHDYPVLAASIAKEKGAKAAFVVSAVGANERSGVFYIKTKGAMERDIIALGFEHTLIFRPSLIMGSRKENRPMEKIFIKIWAVINPLLIGAFDKYKGIEGKDIAKAMVNVAKQRKAKLFIYHWKEMNALK